MVKIYLVRHGETEDNRKKFLCGWSNPSLNELGRQQAHQIAQYLKGKTFHAVYTSSLKRTIETAEIILGEGTTTTNTPLEGLRELHFGDYEGQTMMKVEEEHPDMYQQIRDDAIHFCFPGGESLLEMHNRVNKVMAELITKHQGEEVLVVAHSGVIRSIIAQLITGDIKSHWNYKVDHCSLSIIEEHDDFYILTKLNEKGALHLQNENNRT